MPQLTGELVVRGNAPFGRASTNSIRHRVRNFTKAVEQAEKQGAQTATRVSRANFRYLRPPRPGAQRGSRESTGGRFAEHIDWRVRDGGVELDQAKLPDNWIILEIGTGRRATMHFGGGDDAPAARVRTIPSQRGRRIHRSLVFADPGGNYSPPGASRTEQLFFRDRVTGAPPRNRTRPIVIRREIKGQHFIKKGAQAGFRQYRSSVLAAARRHFRKGSP